MHWRSPKTPSRWNGLTKRPSAIRAYWLPFLAQDGLEDQSDSGEVAVVVRSLAVLHGSHGELVRRPPDGAEPASSSNAWAIGHNRNLPESSWQRRTRCLRVVVGGVSSVGALCSASRFGWKLQLYTAECVVCALRRAWVWAILPVGRPESQQGQGHAKSRRPFVRSMARQKLHETPSTASKRRPANEENNISINAGRRCTSP